MKLPWLCRNDWVLPRVWSQYNGLNKSNSVKPFLMLVFIITSFNNVSSSDNVSKVITTHTKRIPNVSYPSMGKKWDNMHPLIQELLHLIFNFYLAFLISCWRQWKPKDRRQCFLGVFQLIYVAQWFSTHTIQWNHLEMVKINSNDWVSPSVWINWSETRTRHQNF